jgi:hypothetical protein
MMYPWKHETIILTFYALRLNESYEIGRQWAVCSEFGRWKGGDAILEALSAETCSKSDWLFVIREWLFVIYRLGRLWLEQTNTSKNYSIY